MNKLSAVFLSVVLIVTGCPAPVQQAVSTALTYSISFRTVQLSSGILHKDWKVLKGKWETTDQGITTTKEGEAILLFRPRIDWTGRVEIEYSASSDTPGDLSMLLGIPDTLQPIKNSVFIGFGAGANTKTEIEVPGQEPVRTNDILITPGKKHTVNISIKDNICTLTINGKQQLQAPCPVDQIQGNRLALYGWKPGCFHSFSIGTPNNLTYPPTLKKADVMGYELTVLSPELLQQAKARITDKDPALMPAYENLLLHAELKLTEGTYSVMDKKLTPPSGDKHDYMSLGTYWWPDPDSPNGLPYIRKDGEQNPEVNDNSTDKTAYWNMVDSVWTLSLAYYFSVDETYAEHAALLVRTWFLDPASKMNPNLNYAQAIPGRTEGRGIGIIDTNRLPFLQDLIKLLEPSAAWTEEDQAGFEQWIADFLQWLLTSNNGQDEARTHNNHGTWYDAQCAAYALYAGQPEIAHDILLVSRERIIDHIEPDGSQPHELARPRTFNYSIFNLESHLVIAETARKVGLDYWNIETQDGRGSIRKAVDFLLHNAPPADITQWPYQQITPIRHSEPRYANILNIAGYAYTSDDLFKAAAELNDEKVLKSSWRLLYPPK